MGAPQPDRIPYYPQEGVMTYLFRKKITSSDLGKNLTLIGTNNYFEALPDSILNRITDRGGLQVKLYTPDAPVGNVILRDITTWDITTTMTNRRYRYYRVMKPRWSGDRFTGIAQLNEISVNDEIDCWCIYNQHAVAEEESLALLIQKVLPEQVSQVPNLQQGGQG